MKVGLVLFAILTVEIRFVESYMRITPNSVQVSSDGSITDSSNTVVVECNAQDISGTPTAMYIRRGYYPLAQIAYSSTSTQAQLSSGSPGDVNTKNPALEGYLQGGSSSYLRVTYIRDRMDCRDSATYYCIIHYIIDSSGTFVSNTSATLTVQVLPGPLQISAARLAQNTNYVSQIYNLSIVQEGDQLQMTCSGNVGSITLGSAPLIEWYKSTARTSYYAQRIYADTGVTISDGTQSSNDCYYSRTSTMTYTVLSSDTGLAITCMAASQTTSTSGEFRFTFEPVLTSTSDDVKGPNCSSLSPVMPGPLQISAALVTQNTTYVTQIFYLSLVQEGDQLQMTCSGNVGSITLGSAPLIEWYKSTAKTLYIRQRIYADTGVTISDGTQSSNDCYYSRTATMTYTVLSSDTGLAITCMAASQTTSTSGEFRFTFDGSTSASGKLTTNFTLAAIGVFLVCLSSAIIR